ncbi:hypothetical protein SAMN05421503_2432 [Terribacillus aidingensis]|uniref:Uncharacterized protein n=1 Tax=Terribacillus aidingensis TaxID=586416 RepID=A0A285NYF3_9BACI|nr:hypothetical protein [Terribacillus aidingensis]SNZ14510.1 hypothetical protein SAMN05421503_2432 [Terribacillus aidingensis]
MSKVELNVLFKKIQKDDKKEVVEFHVLGDELPSFQELFQLVGSVVVIEVEGNEAGGINAEFKSLQVDAKKTPLKFNVSGGNEDKLNKLYSLAGRNVNILIEPSQMSIDEFLDAAEEHEGVEYTVENDGSVAVPDNQLSFEDIPTGEDGDTAHDDDALN